MAARSNEPGRRPPQASDAEGAATSAAFEATPGAAPSEDVTPARNRSGQLCSLRLGRQAEVLLALPGGSLLLVRLPKGRRE